MFECTCKRGLVLITHMHDVEHAKNSLVNVASKRCLVLITHMHDFEHDKNVLVNVASC